MDIIVKENDDEIISSTRSLGVGIEFTITKEEGAIGQDLEVELPGIEIIYTNVSDDGPSGYCEFSRFQHDSFDCNNLEILADTLGTEIEEAIQDAVAEKKLDFLVDKLVDEILNKIQKLMEDKEIHF